MDSQFSAEPHTNKIVFCPCASLSNSNEVLNNLEKVYKSIQYGRINESDTACKYDPNFVDFQFENGVLLKEDGNYVTVLLSSDLCFVGIDSVNATLAEKSPDFLERKEYPIYMAFYEWINYFKAIAGTTLHTKKVVEEFSDYVMRNPIVDQMMFPRTKQGMLDMLTSQNNLFNRLIHEFQSRTDFFIESPVEAVWKDRGYFHINNGIDRICFFLTLGLQFVPAKITKQDYYRWLNKEKLDKCISYAKTNHVVAAYAPIPHPNFYFFPAYRDIGGHKRIQKIAEFLMYNHISIKGKKVLDAGSYYCYLSQFFARIGAEVTAVEFNPTSSEFGKLLNELLYCSNIQSICTGIDNIDTSERFSFTIMLTVLYWHLNTPLGLQILHNVDLVTENFLLWESGDEPESEIQFILENSSFNKYIKISETIGTGKVRELGVFCKEHVQLDCPDWIF